MTRRPTVLVVDDHLDTLEMLSEYLAARGCRVLTASSGEEALDLAAAERPAVVLLDIAMPHLSGYDVARRLRHEAADSGAPAILPGARLIATTGCASEAQRDHALECGFDLVVAKPYELEALLAIVRAH